MRPAAGLPPGGIHRPIDDDLRYYQRTGADTPLEQD